MLRMTRWLFFAFYIFATVTHAQTKPDIFLLQTYDDSRDVIGWVMSEKLDGVRGIWDGENLRSRNGNILHAPEWFTRDFPPFALDGELWTKRADFENIVSIVRRKTPDARWRQLRYHIFEVPRQPGGLRARLAVLESYLASRPVAHLQIIPQMTVYSDTQLKTFLADITSAGGEGAVVRDPATPYRTGRLASALKLKTHTDTECTITKILPGNGKYTGKMGALQCQMADGTVLKIGTGFTDDVRANPPPIGTVITFKYYGLTKNGLPRFPVYLRVRR